MLARTTLTFQPNSPLLLRETGYCYKTITFHSYILFEFNQFIDTCIIICVYFLFIPFCIFSYSESVYIFIFDACCFSAILVWTLYGENKALMNEQHIRITACIKNVKIVCNKRWFTYIWYVDPYSDRYTWCLFFELFKNEFGPLLIMFPYIRLEYLLIWRL